MSDKRKDFAVFYSWQSDLPDATNRGSVRTALHSASKTVEAELPTLKLVVDEATREEPGSPNIPATILSKIAAADAFVCDITTINAVAADSMRRVPNPNVAFELGYAVGQLGWSRIILVFNLAFGELKDAPFDFDRHRILTYTIEPKDAKDKGRQAALTASLGKGLSLIARSRPPKPSQATENASSKKTMHLRDVENLRWVLSTIHLPTLDQMVMELPDMVHSKVLHFWAGFDAVVASSLFHLYDAKLCTAVRALHDAWNVCLSHGEQYHQATNPEISLFKNQGDMPFTTDQDRIWKQIKDAAGTVAVAKSELLERVRKRYLEVDIAETNKSAWEEYVLFNSDLDKIWGRPAKKR